MKTIRRYSELVKLQTIEERYDYLKLNGVVGKQSWGWDRYFNQRFYRSLEWKSIRNKVILRDEGCDLGVPEFEIHSRILIHHMNPIWVDDLRDGNEDILDPEFLITTCERTHQAIHYGDKSLLPQVPIVRLPGDTRLWGRS
jgi:hypothetical protein